jgi:hypothetical protein
VRVEGLDVATGLNVHLDVRRGGSNPVNDFEFNNCRVVRTDSWMSQIDSERTLNQIVLPGSHDGGMGETRDCFPAIITAEFSKTQKHMVRGQLDHGARYFDIRVDYDNGKLVTYHRSGTNSPIG